MQPPRYDDSYKAFDPNFKMYEINIIEVKKETEKAWLLVLPLKSKKTIELWFPKKECKVKGGKLSTPKWLIDLKNRKNITPNNP